MRRVVIGAVLAVALVAAFGGARGARAATPLDCGAVVTATTTLTADIGPCNQGGIVIAASGVTLDLGGHTIQGKPRVGDGVGVLFNHVTNARVTNGTVMGFDAGVQIMGGGSNEVDHVFARRNIAGVKSDKNLGDGITIFQSNNNVITGNTVVNNGPYSGISVVDDASAPSIGSSGNVISFNTVTANTAAAAGASVTQDDGIRIEGPNATGTVVENNTVTQNGLDGIAVFADQTTGFPNTGTQVLNNTVTGNGFNTFVERKGHGIVLFGAPGSPTVHGANNSTVAGNSVANNAADGIRVASTGNTISGNTATGNDAFPAITAWDMEDATTSPPCDANTWTGNTFGTSNQSCIG